MKESVTCNLSTCDSPKANSYNPEFMKEAIRIAVENVENGTGLWWVVCFVSAYV